MRHAQRDWQRSWNTEGISRSTRQTTRAVMTSKKHFRKKKMKLHGLCDALIEKQAKEDPREFCLRASNQNYRAKARMGKMKHPEHWKA
jgi:hypothetical protein